MPSVLAIEPEFDRAALLRGLADEHVRGPLTLVESVDAALDAIDRRVPEVILISPLMPPQEEAQLVARLRALPKAIRVQTLITPELAAPSQPARGLYSRRQRRAPASDPSAFVDQVNECLDIARERQDEPLTLSRGGAERRYLARLECDQRPTAIVDGAAASLLDVSPSGAQVLSPRILVPGRLIDVAIDYEGRMLSCRATVVWGSFEANESTGRVGYRAGIDFADGYRLPESFGRNDRDDAHDQQLSLVRPRSAVAQHRADRLTASDLPWLSAVKLPWGGEATLLNLSRTGVLVETLSKFTPGSSAAIELCSADDVVVVPARFVRSDVVTVDGRGVRYRAAAVFEKEIDLEELGVSLPAAASGPKEIAEWLRKLANDIYRSRDPGALRRRIKDGLTRLVSARDVEIRRAPVPPPDGCESFYFTVADRAPHRSVLQVTFDEGHVPSELDFRILQAGAALATVLSQFEH